ncbi:MAG: HEAT repeat domain-containing protein [Planctomycetota bacterium]
MVTLPTEATLQAHGAWFGDRDGNRDRFRDRDRKGALGVFVLLALIGCAASRKTVSDYTDEDSARIARAMPSAPCVEPREPRTLLVFSRCEGYVHEVIPTTRKALQIMGEMTGAFTVVCDDDPAVLSPESLARFDGILLNNTTQLKLDDDQRRALLDFVKQGKGIGGIHAATDNFYEWSDGAELMGGLFDGHPWGAGGTWAVKIDEPEHPLNASFRGAAFLVTDEIYQMKGPYSRATHRVLLSLDMSNLRNRQVAGINRADGDFAISWIKRCGSGRLFYCSLGHNEEVVCTPAILEHYLAGIQYVLGDYVVDDRPSAGLEPRPAARLTTESGAVEDPFAVIPRYEFGDSRVPLAALEEEIRIATPAQRQMIEHRLLDILAEPTTTFAGKQFICRMLPYVGTDASIPLLATLLRDDELSDAARFALQGMTSATVDRVLREALSSASPQVKMGVIDSLSRRRDREAIEPLAELGRGENEEVARAALLGLGRIGGTEAAAALDAIDVAPSLRIDRAHARLMVADALLGEGARARALAIYREMTEASYPTPVRVAAWRGVVRAEPENAAQVVVALSKDDDPEMRRTAAKLVGELPSEMDVQALVEELPALGSDAQVLALAALATRGARSAAPAVAQLATSSDAGVRAAALRALRFLGSAEHVELLTQALSEEGELREAAAYSLQRLSGEGVDTAIDAAVRAGEGSVRAALLSCVVVRRPPGAVDLLVHYAGDEDPQVRTEALKGLGTLAREEELPAIVRLLDEIRTDDDRQALEEAIHAACQRIEEGRRSDYLLEVLPGSEPDRRASLLRMLGRLADERALASLVGGARDESELVRVAAIGALAEWPRSTPLQALFEIAGSTPEAAERHLALEGCLRMIALPAERSAADTESLYRQAMSLARTDADKKLVVAGVAQVAELWVLGFLEPLAGEGTLSSAVQETRDAVVALLSRKVPHDAQGCPVELAFPYAERYSAGSKDALTDGNWGSMSHDDGRWQGFEGKDLIAVVDLGRSMAVQSIRASFLRELNSWIFLPVDVEFACSKDGVTYERVAWFELGAPTQAEDVIIHDCAAVLDRRLARFVRVTARSVGTCPPWHSGAGGAAWIFVDEIQVNPHLELPAGLAAAPAISVR